jgi:hypothetical protein
VRAFFSIKRRELILFSVFGLVYLVFALAWSWTIADNPAINPGQNLSKMVMIWLLTLLTAIYAVIGAQLDRRSGEQGDSEIGTFLIRQGAAMVIYICITQILAVLLQPLGQLITSSMGLARAEWRSPTQGIPLMYTLCLGGFIGIVLAGIGSDLVWGRKRDTFLAQTARRR